MWKKLLGMLVLIAVLGLIMVGTLWSSVASPPREVAKNYILALASQDVETALEYSSGSAAFTASRLKEPATAGHVEFVSCKIDALSRNWARVQAMVELILQDGSVDVGWYNLELVKNGQAWKVISFQEAEPGLIGISRFTKQTGFIEVKEVFQGYLDELAVGDWQGSLKYLAGPARKSQEMSLAMLEKGTMLGEVKELNMESVWSRDNGLVARFSYRLHDRDISVLAWFYKTHHGWKIVKIVQE